MDGPTKRIRADGRRGARLSLALLLVLAACGGPAHGGMGSSLSPDLIARDEIDASNATNAYDLITQVRPNWLRGRGSPSIRYSQVQLPVVYLEDRRQGGLEVLRSFPVAGIAEIRYINAANATTRFGNGHAGGVIQVVPRRR
ncbi:MAG: hypothetical protein FIA95_14080 [Gemmatimonadetes bacterium]|nr:hypothetical protein [Gemmatimonadota bacterium]